MALELLGGRMLAPFFGNSTYVWGSIITVFMLALSIGYLLGGRWSMTSPSLKRLALLFVGSALLLALVASIAQPVIKEISTVTTDPRYGALLAAFILFLPPSIMMGMVSPYCVRLANTSLHESGNTAGALYFISTLGSALGTIATSFYFVVWLQINQIIYAIALTLLASAIVAYFRPPVLIESNPALSTID